MGSFLFRILLVLAVYAAMGSSKKRDKIGKQLQNNFSKAGQFVNSIIHPQDQSSSGKQREDQTSNGSKGSKNSIANLADKFVKQFQDISHGKNILGRGVKDAMTHTDRIIMRDATTQTDKRGILQAVGKFLKPIVKPIQGKLLWKNHPKVESL
ncbi:hypothetical protein Y032_0014g2382 [Ancylostoma ceylanicum]|uniref:SXP/RAL-2 family protein Ani s 5-like cation-binding domain-containing protein n=1 Tax=Ancylostoma ceylanicum TaxID=53326 RepID=A0A016V9U7_9BILA|nr:hypothetical protein Y032_0014g2382 [Ancylostoma ceylanicum]